MRSSPYLIAAIFFVWLSSAHAIELSNFTPTKLSAVADEMAGAAKLIPDSSKGKTYFDMRFPGRSAVVEFSGKTRKIDAGEKTYLVQLAKNVGSTDLAAQYESEIEVKEAGKTYWLGIQNLQASVFKDEVKAGKKVIVYFRVAGFASAKQNVFLMMEFDANPETIAQFQK